MCLLQDLLFVYSTSLLHINSERILSTGKKKFRILVQLYWIDRLGIHVLLFILIVRLILSMMVIAGANTGRS